MESTGVLFQLLSKVGLNCQILQVLHHLFKLQCARLDGRRIQAGDATDQRFELVLLRH